MTIRVLVVDDSVVVRRSVADILGAEDDVTVVATASDGLSGLRRIEEHRPDVVTLDVEMPGLDGLGTLREIRRRWPRLPVVMYSSLTERGAATTLEALSLGAVDYATKPRQVADRGAASAHVRETLLPVVRLWGTRPVPSAATAGPPTGAPARAPRPLVVLPPPRGSAPALVVVGVSTGGPDALARVVPALPTDLPVPVVVVQHMPPVFTQLLAERLARASDVPVTEAVDGETLRPGRVYVAPGGRHTQVRPGPQGTLEVRLGDEPPEHSCRPAADVLFRSAVAALGGRVLAVVLTGMGQDAREGARLVHAAGGHVIAQDEASSVVWGMPGFVAKDGTASFVLPLAEIAPAVAALTQPVLAGVAR